MQGLMPLDAFAACDPENARRLKFYLVRQEIPPFTGGHPAQFFQKITILFRRRLGLRPGGAPCADFRKKLPSGAFRLFPEKFRPVTLRAAICGTSAASILWKARSASADPIGRSPLASIRLFCLDSRPAAMPVSADGPQLMLSAAKPCRRR